MNNLAHILVRKSGPLKGNVKISGAKNAVLPVIAATLLAEGVSTIKGVPDLRDVHVYLTMQNWKNYFPEEWMEEQQWQGKAEEIKNLVRGLNPIIGAYTYIENKKIKYRRINYGNEGHFEQNVESRGTFP